MSNGTKMLITDAGLAEVVNAEASGTAPVVLSHIAFGTGQYTATANMTALKSEFKRFDSVKGGAISDNVIHLSIHDNSTDTYSVYEVGVFTESGTLFGVYSQTTPIVQKATDAEVMLVIDIALSDINVESITVGDTNFILNPATTTTKGIVELATEAEAKAGTDTTKAITPATLDATIEAHANILHKSGNETINDVKTFNKSPRVPTASSSSNDTTSANTEFVQLVVAAALEIAKNYTNTAQTTLQSSINTETAEALSSAKTYTDEEVAEALSSAKSYTDTEKAKYLPLTGGKMTATKAMTRDVADSFLGLHGGTGENNDGAQMYLCGANHSTNPSSFQLLARNSEISKILEGRIDGFLTWVDKYVLNNSFQMPTDGGAVMLTAGTSSTGGAYFRLYGKDHSSGAGQFILATTDGETTKVLTGKPDGTLTWNGERVLTNTKITTLSATSGTVSLSANNIYTMSVSGTTTFSLATPTDKTVFNQIKLMMKVTGTPTINWGTTYFFNKSTPSISAGSYDVYFDYDNLLSAWVCGVIPKGTSA